MFSLVLKQTLARRGRLALSVAAVILGVAFVVGALVLSSTSQRVFDEQFDTASSQVDLTVRDTTAFDSAMGVEVDRDPLPARLVDEIAGVPGVESATGVVKGSGLLVHEGRPIVPRGPSMLSSWVPEGLTGFTLASGTAPTERGDLVVDVATARREGITVGDRVRVQSNASRTLTVTGLARFGDHDGLPNTTVALVDLPTAQQLVEVGSKLSEVLVTATPGTATTQLADTVASALDDRYDVSASRDTAAASAAAAKNQLSFLRVTLFVLAGAALLIGGFLIANTFTIVVTQRTRELALLRAAGATGRQVFWSVVGEAGVVGTVGGVAGAITGIGAAAGLRSLAAGLGIPIPDAALVIEPTALAAGAVLGLGITMLAAVVPARRAARVAPVEAMRALDTGDSRSDRRTRVGLLTLAIGMGAAGFGLSGGPVTLVALAGVLTVVALVLTGPALAPALSRVVGAPLRRLGVPGRMASESATRSPRRTAATMTALTLSLGLLVFMGTLASSVRATMASTYTEVVTADYVLESARGEMLGGLSHEVHHAVMDLPEVDVVSRMQYGHWKEGQQVRALTAIEPETIDDVTDVTMVDGSLTALSEGGIVLSDTVATDRDLAVGDSLPMTFSKVGKRQLEVVGLIDSDDAQALSTDYLIATDTYARLFSERMDATLFISAAADTTPADVEAALDRALRKFPTVEVRDQREAVDGRMMTVDQVLGLVTVLLMFTVLIALLGITNTLALSIVERTREIGLLRAVGMTRRQLTAMIRGEAMLVAALALVLAVALGAAMGAAAVQVIGRNADLSVNLPYTQLLVALVAATTTGLLAGLVPARRAARLDVLTAVATE